MATVTARLAALGENANVDQEKDANALLLELEKGLRSANVGEQCEAIVRFPRLFEKYPFPIFINSAFLKLADVFRGGTNELRFQVLRVAQQSVKHLDKILSVDEFVQRIFYVIHSNHAVARAITLRTLGSVARIISERKNVHHSIINGLDSHDTVELEAAIYAAQNFAAQSKSFAGSICSKLVDMISGLATPVEMKLKLIPIFQHMHHEPATSEKVWQLCTELLPTHPAQDVVMVTLHTLSQLATKSLLHLPQQLQLLLDYLQSDPRMKVKVLVLKDLQLLANRGPHMWSEENIKLLCDFIHNNPYDRLKIGGLSVMVKLSESVAISKFKLEGQMDSCISESCYSSNVLVACRAATLLSNIAIHTSKAAGSGGCEEALEGASLAVETLITVTCAEQTTNNLAALKTVLLCVGRLCEACPALTDRFVDTIITTLATVPAPCALLLCECVSNVSGQQRVRLSGLVPDLVDLMKQQLAEEGDPPVNHKLIVALWRLLFQASVGEHRLPGAAGAALDELLGQGLAAVGGAGWTAYKLARQAARYGHHANAATIFGSLTLKVSTENFDYWLCSLQSVSAGESSLQGREGDSLPVYVRKLSRAVNHYHRGLAAIKAAALPNHPLSFQTQYVQLRVALLQVYLTVIKACNSYQTSPPPAIATSQAMTTGNEIHRCSHVVQQLKKCRSQFEDLSKRYGELYQTAFDADTVTLTNIHIIQQSCQVLIYVINTLLNKAEKPSSTVNVLTSVTLPSTNVPLELQPWIETSEAVLQNLQTAVSTDNDMPLSHHHMQCIADSVMNFAQVPICLPRYFFQRLQTTDIKLAISPQAKSAGDTIPIHYDTDLTLKVEGVVQHGEKPGLFRRLKEVQVSVKSTQTSRTQMANDTKLQENPTNELTNTAEPHNDYFSTQFLLAFPIAGLHTVTIEVGVIDEQGAVWLTGPRQTITIKSYDEAIQRQQQQQFAAQRQQQRAALAHRDNFITIN